VRGAYGDPPTGEHRLFLMILLKSLLSQPALAPGNVVVRCDRNTTPLQLRGFARLTNQSRLRLRLRAQIGRQKIAKIRLPRS